METLFISLSIIDNNELDIEPRESLASGDELVWPTCRISLNRWPKKMVNPSGNLHKIRVRYKLRHGPPTELAKVPISCLKNDILVITQMQSGISGNIIQTTKIINLYISYNVDITMQLP